MNFVSDGVPVVNDIPIKFALREMTALMRSKKVWAGLGAATVILGLSGPFDTIDVMPLLERLTYWGLIVVTTFFSGGMVADLVLSTRAMKRVNKPIRIAIAGLVIGIAVTLIVLALNWISMGLSPFVAHYAFYLMLNCIVIATVIAAAMTWAQAPSDPAGPAPILQRLDLEKRGPLLSLTQRDHYVEVTTTAGESLILMRLSDAIAETTGTDGMQIHRSHWIATHAVTVARRDGARAVVTLQDGRELPVSRTYLKDLTAAGLLPKKGSQNG
ncbi:MAG: hypothetical protein GKR98_17005 [Boseongicola sp.]|nr:MAG: hypothetical protein GKR98_17005 [Boseongicola sp.]